MESFLSRELFAICTRLLEEDLVGSVVTDPRSSVTSKSLDALRFGLHFERMLDEECA